MSASERTNAWLVRRHGLSASTRVIAMNRPRRADIGTMPIVEMF